MTTPKQKTQKKKHAVTAQVQILDLTRAGSSIQLEIFAEGVKLGTIDLGQGSVNWRKARYRYWGTPISWTKFAALMDEVSYPAKK